MKSSAKYAISKNQSYNNSSNKQNIAPNINIPGISNLKINHKFTSPSHLNSKDDILLMMDAIQNKSSVSNNLKNVFTQLCQKLNNSEQFNPFTFIELLKFVLGKHQLSINEAIQVCEDNGITKKQHLMEILEGKWEYKKKQKCLKTILLEDLGQLKVLQIKKFLENGIDLTDEHYQILQILCPQLEQVKIQMIEEGHINYKLKELEIKKQTHKLENFFNEKIVKKLKSKFQLYPNEAVDFEKKVRKISDRESLSFQNFNKIMHELGFTSQDILNSFKYMQYLEKGVLTDLVDRTKSINAHLFIREICGTILTSNNLTSKITQRFNDQHQNKCNQQIIEMLLKDKETLMQALNKKEKELNLVKRNVQILQLEVMSTKKAYQERLKLQKQALNSKYQKQITKYKSQSQNNSRVAQWYRHQLECVMNKFNQESNNIKKLSK